MASFASAIATARAGLFETVGSLATFTSAAGTVATPYVVIREGQELYPGEFTAQAAEQVRTVRYQFSDIGRETVPGETFLQGGITYTCKHTISNDGKTVTVAVK